MTPEGVGHHDGVYHGPLMMSSTGCSPGCERRVSRVIRNVVRLGVGVGCSCAVFGQGSFDGPGAGSWSARGQERGQDGGADGAGRVGAVGGDVECSVFLGPWFLVVSGCVFAASQLVFDLVGGAVAER